MLEELKADPLQRKKVVVFSASNRQDPLDGYPGFREGLPELNFEADSPLRQLVEHHHAELRANAHTALRIEPLLTIDEGALRKTLNYYFQHATVVEAMVVALQHMQISVCTMRGFSGKSGLSCFRKNIICFPQELLELQQLQELMSNLSPNDAVDVAIKEPGADTPVLRRARILDRLHSGFLVDVPGHSSRLSVSREQIRRRVVLPWKPADLRDYLVIFRRRNASKDDYVEDLRTRRAFIKNLLQILTAIERWRADEHPGPMHQYYTGFDVRNDEDIDLLCPADAVPEGLHF